MLKGALTSNPMSFAAVGHLLKYTLHGTFEEILRPRKIRDPSKWRVALGKSPALQTWPALFLWTATPSLYL
ncbi:MAG: hypothetical protein DMG32_15770 [Acidobacteria bacterium]|nr:MAG: hypothetical protein DMG32_15770 [Acidobacteriota bacterium]